MLGRFARGVDARGEGTGLGLAIAAAQAARHGGRLELGESELGGLQARVELRAVDRAGGLSGAAGEPAG